MAYLRFESRHPKHTRLTYQIDGQLVLCKKLAEDVSAADIVVTNGEHTLFVTKQTWYDTPLCYLNVINPVFFLYHLKFLSRTLCYDESFAAQEITFSVRDPNKELYLQTELLTKRVKGKGGEEYLQNEIVCKKAENAKILRRSGRRMPVESVRRFKLVRILSAAVYALLLNTLCICGLIQQGGSAIAVLLFCLFLSVFSGEMVYRAATSKSVEERIAVKRLDR